MKNPNYGLVNTTADAFNVKNKFNKEIIFALYYNKANDTATVTGIRPPNPKKRS